MTSKRFKATRLNLKAGKDIVHNAIEPIIGHMKEDNWLGRNLLKSTLGDKLNALVRVLG